MCVIQAGTLFQQLGKYADRIRHGMPPSERSQAANPSRWRPSTAAKSGLFYSVSEVPSACGAQLREAWSQVGPQRSTRTSKKARVDTPVPALRQAYGADKTCAEGVSDIPGAQASVDHTDAEEDGHGCSTSGLNRRCNICMCDLLAVRLLAASQSGVRNACPTI